jgi:3-phenylpropionate/trans-cinnamate dioxygenase ferredoxin reductase subunit
VIVLVGAEPELPYERPHLSKGYLAGTVSRERLALRPAEQYRELEVELALGDRVADIGVERHAVELESGRTISWDLLCIATGSSARRLPGVDEAFYLRELPDAVALRDILHRGGVIDVIGAGFIGCEVAAVAIQKGCQVRMFEALEQPLLKVVGPELGDYVGRQHRDHGVELRFNVATPPKTGAPLLAGIGSVPRTDLAERAGLVVDRGIVVDELGHTSAPQVFAAGDVTRFFSPLFESRIRVEHFQTAQRQGFAVGRVMTGAKQPYDEVPWFWSDQYDLNLQYIGAGLHWDQTVTRGRFGRPPFTVFYLQQGRLVAAAGINDHHTIARARRVMEARVALTRDQLEDPAFDLRRAIR